MAFTAATGIDKRSVFWLQRLTFAAHRAFAAVKIIIGVI